MDKLGFYNRLSEVIGRPLSTLEIDLLDIACEPDPVLKKRLESDVAEEFIRTTKGRLPEFISLENVVSRADERDYGYWLYDRRTRVWMIGMSKGTHEHLAGLLYSILTDDKFYSLETNAEKYIEECFGFFVSGSMNMYIPIKADNCLLSDDELIFNQLKGKLTWRGI